MPDFWLEYMKYILWQEGYNGLHVGVSLPCKLHIPEPIHTLPPTPLLAFPLPGLPLPAPPAAPTSSPDFPMSSEPSCLGILLPDSFSRVPLGFDELRPDLWPASLQLLYFTPSLCSSHPIPKLPCHLQGYVLQTYFEMSLFYSSFKNSLKTYLFLRLTLRMFSKVKQNKVKKYQPSASLSNEGNGPHCSSVFNWLHG